MGEGNTIDRDRATRRRGLIFSLMVVVSLSGLAVMDYWESYAYLYWIVLTCCFGVASVALSWYAALESDHAAHRQAPLGSHLRKQALHWLTLILVFVLAYFLHDPAGAPPETKGMVALLLLAVTTILAGIHFEWRMALLGLILLGTFVSRVLVDDLFWAMIVVAVALAFVLPRFRSRAKTSEI
jgi:hypothetical protein